MRSELFTPVDSDNSSSALNDRKAALQRESEERATERAQKIAAQSSPFTAPDQRILLWEKLHGLQLPLSPTHKLLHVIAQQTDLTVRQVQDEQKRRATGEPIPEGTP
jgi:hypothetical protein